MHIRQKHSGMKVSTKPEITLSSASPWPAFSPNVPQTAVTMLVSPSALSGKASNIYNPEHDNDMSASSGASSHSPPSPSQLVSVPLQTNHSSSSLETNLVLPNNLQLGTDGILLDGNEHKLKYSNLPATVLKIGEYQKNSVFCGDLRACFNFQQKKFIWEIFANSSLLFKIECKFSDVTGMNVETPPDGTSIITFELAVPPTFYHGYLTHHKPINWISCPDFTTQALVSVHSCVSLYSFRSSSDMFYISIRGP